MKIGLVKNVYRKARRQINPKGIILLYHRIAKPDNDPWELSVNPNNFQEQLEVLRTKYEVVTLRELSEEIVRKKRRKKLIALTFDDGYKDNYYSARRWLELYKVPATFFVASGYIGSDREFWWDELERLLLTSNRLPQVLQLSKPRLNWDLGHDAEMTLMEYHKYKSWAYYSALPTQRHGLYLALWQMIRDYSFETQKQILNQLASWAGMKDPGRQENYPMTHEELLRFSESEYVEIGGHTCSHPRLVALSRADQKREIINGKTTLESWINKEVIAFSYPYGSFNQISVELVREAGFQYACTSRSGLVNGSQTPLTLPRTQVKNWNGQDFEQKLYEWFGSY